MAQPKAWLDFITDDQGRSFFYENGMVGVQAVPRWLQVGPDGWQDNTVKWARNQSYHGIFRSYTTPFKYVKDGAKIVRDQLIRYGTERKLYHVRHKLDKSFGGGWQHKLFFKGELDLTRTQGDDDRVTVNIMEGGLSKFLAANENTQYEIDLDVPEARYIKHDGIELKQTASMLVLDNFQSAQNGNHSVPLQMLSQETIALNIKGADRVQLGGNNGSDQNHKLVDEGLWFHKSTTGQDISISWDFNMTAQLADGIPPNPGVQLFLVVRNLRDDGSLVAATTLNQFNGPTNVYRKNHFVGQTTITGIEPGTSLYLFMGINIIGDSGDRAVTFTYDPNEPFSFNITDASYRHRTTFIKAHTPMYIAQKLLDKMTGGGYTFSSNYLYNDWNNLLITSGDAIRGIQGAKIKTSWRDFYDSYNGVCNLSCEIKDTTLIVERKINAYLPYQELDLLEVNDFNDDIAYDWLYNVFKFGYPNTDTRDLNGRDEFNVTVTYTTAVTKAVKTYDVVSKYMASMYEIENIRLNLDGKTTTDGENDNTVFFIHGSVSPQPGGEGEPVEYYTLIRNVYDSVTGLISPSTAFNIELHPELCMRRHGNFIRGSLYWLDGTNIVRETSDKNDKVIVIKNGQTYIGNKNTLVGTLDSPLFIPISFKVTSPMPKDTIDVLYAGPTGAFGFTYKGAKYYGYPLDVGIQPVDRPAQETIMLCSPMTDINQLRFR